MFGYTLIKTSKLNELKNELKALEKFYYVECNGYEEVCKMIDHIYDNLKEKTRNKDKETTKQQVWLLDRKDKTIFFARYNVIRNRDEITQWIYSEDEPKNYGKKLTLKEAVKLK